MAELAPPVRKGSTPQQRRDFEAELKAKVALSEKYKALWSSLNDFIHRRGDAWLVSPPGARDLRIEALQFSEIPAELETLGYHLSPAGTGTKILGGKFTPIVYFQFQIPTPR
jgi:hypothetical protein